MGDGWVPPVAEPVAEPVKEWVVTGYWIGMSGDTYCDMVLYSTYEEALARYEAECKHKGTDFVVLAEVLRDQRGERGRS